MTRGPQVVEDLWMRPLKHGYTNSTLGDGAVVEKTYEGPDADLRLRREHTLLTRLQDQLPVPPVHAATTATLTLGFMAGTSGRDLLEAQPAAVLASCGELLRRIRMVAPDVLTAGRHEASEVHLGAPVEDLAWCEWIVRMHHPGCVHALNHFFRAYSGQVPTWADRRAAMLARCEQRRQFCDRWEANGPGMRQWKERTAMTASWSE